MAFFVPSFTIKGVTVNANRISAAKKLLRPLAKVLPADVEERSSWRLDGRLVGRARTDNLHPLWNVEDDSNLLRGIYEYGMESWEAIKNDPSLKLGDRILRLEVDKKLGEQALKKRVKYLLNILESQIKTRVSILKYFYYCPFICTGSELLPASEVRMVLLVVKSPPCISRFR